MAQEDNLRALGKIMDFMRDISVLFLHINCYWFCYSAFETWHFTLAIIDKILLNFQRTTGLFSSMLWTKLFCVVFLGLSCLGTKGVKEEKITWGMIYSALAVGFVLFFLNWWLLVLPISAVGAASLYIFSLSLGYICLLMAGVWMSRLLKNNLMDDVFNMENESFMQETRLMQNEYSVNLPTRFYYKKKWNKEQIEKGFAMYIYDYKFTDLSEIAYNHLRHHLVSQNLRRRQVLHLSTRHWIPQSPLCADISHPYRLWWIGELPFTLYGCLEGWCARSATRADCFGKDTSLTYNFAHSRLGNDERWFFPWHPPPREPKVLAVGNNPDCQNIYSAALGLYNSRIVKLTNKKKNNSNPRSS